MDYEDALGPWLITTPRYSSTQVGTTIVISGCEVFGSKEYNIELQWRCLNSHAIQRFGDYWIVSPINFWDNYGAALKQSAAAIVSLFIVDQTWWLYKIMLVSYVISINYMVHPEKVTRVSSVLNFWSIHGVSKWGSAVRCNRESISCLDWGQFVIVTISAHH